MRPNKDQTIAAEKQSGVSQETPIGHSLEMKDKPANSKLKSSCHQQQVSAQVDQVDGIDLEKDPIEASLVQRMTQGGSIKSVLRCRTQDLSQSFFMLRLKAPEQELPAALRESPMHPVSESPAKSPDASGIPSSANRTPLASEGRNYSHFLNSNIDVIQEEEIKAAAEVVALTIDTKGRSRHKRNLSLHHALHAKNVLNQEDATEGELLGEEGNASDGEGEDRSINIIIEPQEQENDNIKLSEEFDNDRIQNTINNIALK